MGFPLAVLREILGICYFFLALGLTLALVSANMPRNWIGEFGEQTAYVLTLIFGGWVSYALPGVLFLFSIQQFRAVKMSWTRPIFKMVGVTLLICSLCALFALMASAQSKSEEYPFFAGGIIGAFLTSPKGGLGVSESLGPLGAGLVFGGTLIISILLVTEYLLRELFGQGATVVRGAYQFSRSSVMAHLNRRVQPAGEADAGADKPFWRGGFGRGFFGSGRRGFEREEPLPTHDRTKSSMPRIIDRSGAHPQGDEDEEPLKPARRKREDKKKSGEDKPLFPRRARRSAEVESIFEGIDDQSNVEQPEIDLFESAYEVPKVDLLNPPPKRQFSISQDEILETSGRLEQTLREFGVEAKVVEVVQGPVVTRFELQPAAGVKVNRISGLDREIAMALLAESVRIQAPIPGKAAIGIEIPNKKMNAVVLREILLCDEFQNHGSPLAFGLGKDISGEPIICDLAGMPHLLIAGATGAGKSVCLNSIIISILMRMPPDRVKFIMIDPKRVELSNYQDIPHLLAPVVVDPRKAAGALAWAIEEMERRYRQLATLHVRNIGAYNQVVADALDNGKALKDKSAEPMPYIVLVVDELADLMLVARSEVEEGIQRLAQMSRAVGIHLILATQRPSVNVITGVIKANFPTRIAFRVSSKVDSRTILDANGAEALLGRGDMIYSPGGARTYRVQGAFVSDAEVERVSDMIREQGPPQYQKDDFIAARGKKGNAGGAGDGDGEGSGLADIDVAEEFGDELYLPALKLVLESRQASVSLIQRRMKIGYARAGRLMDLMEQNGIVGPYQGSKPRDLLVDPDQHLMLLEEQGLIVRDGFRAD